MKPKILILRAAGTNCERETAWGYQLAGAETEIIHINRLVEKPDILDSYQALTIPGGFSYGDDIGSGKIFANQLKFNLMESIDRLIDRKGLILGICNGFQVLIKSGLLGEGVSTLTHNDSGKYIDIWVKLKVNGSASVFLKNLEDLELPIAHAEGKFVMKDADSLDTMNQKELIALSYNGVNPNGSENNIAGLCDSSGQILGLMPHPERFLRFENHPRWTRMKRPEDDKGTGLRIFENAVRYLNEL